MLGAVCPLACDLGTPHSTQPSVGPPLQVVTDGSTIGPGKSYTVDQPLRVAFNRFLNPASVIRQSVYLEDSSHNILDDPLVAYDPVLATVTLSNPGSMQQWLTPTQDYYVVLNVPGLVAIDGAPLAASQTIQFTAGPAASPPAGGEPVIQFCRDVLPIFEICSGCHGLPGTNSYAPAPDGGETLPFEGLILTTVDGIRATALSQVADESNTGPLAAPASYPINIPFGIDMPIIAPTEPGNSWLMYKLLLATPASTTEDLHSGAPDFDLTAPSDLLMDLQADRTTLGNYVLGHAMPYTGTPLNLHELELVRAWIEQGARFDHDPCPPSP
jgi:hypothetical protein